MPLFGQRRERSRPPTTEALRKTLGDRVLHLRTKKGLSRAQLKERGGPPAQQTDRIERGLVDAELGLIEQLERALGLGRGELLWPVWSPGEAQRAEQLAIDRATHEAFELHRGRLAALTSGQALNFVDNVGRLLDAGRLSEAFFLMDLVELAADRAARLGPESR